MRDFFRVTLVILLLTAGAGLAWLTQNPETPWLEEAQTWPGVGPLAKEFRRAYLGPQHVGEHGEDEVDEEAVDEEPIILVRKSPSGKRIETEVKGSEGLPTEPFSIGPTKEELIARAEALEKAYRPSKPAESVEVRKSLSGMQPLGYLEHDWFLPGQTIASGVGSGSVIRHRLNRLAYLPILDRDGVWSKVIFQDQHGWIDTSWQPPYPRRKSRRGIARHRYEPVQASDSQRLKKAKTILGVEKPNRKLGPYELFTDIEDEDLLDFLDLTARKAEDAYFARFSRLPSGDPTRSVILFAREDDYLEFYGREGEIRTGGHAFKGALAMWVGSRPRQVLAKTLVHEITHLTNSRALAASLPSWLQEGLAVELGTVYIEDTVAASKILNGSEYAHPSMLGADVSILRLSGLLERNALPTLDQLVQLDDYETFLKPEIVTYSYAHSGAFIRFLLDGQDQHYREGFHDFLGKIAAGFRPTPTLLFKHLDQEAAVVDQHFRTWLVEAAVEARKDLEASLPENVTRVLIR